MLTYQEQIAQNPRIKYRTIVRRFFKNADGETFHLTNGQCDIFRMVFEPDIRRATIRTVTQYGKSETTSMALITAAIDRREKILIIAPSAKQASIIMNNVIGHLFDHPLITQMIVYEGSLDRLRAERSKTRITFKNGSEIFILTAEADTLSKEGSSLMGFGATMVIVDESSLIPDVIWAKILRMVGGQKAGKIVQLGNPFERNHFYKAFFSPRYEKLIIKKEQAIAEGRLTTEFIAEAQEDMSPLEFLIFYDCEFPEGGASDALIPYDWIMIAINQAKVGGEETQAGLDVARYGRDSSVYTLRKGGRTIRIKEYQTMDTMELVGNVSGDLDADEPEITAVDVIGIGAGVFDRLNEMGYRVVEINVGESPLTDDSKGKFANYRAEIYWALREQFRPEGEGDNRHSKISIPNDSVLIKELTEIRYKYNSERKIKIEDKEDMKKRLGRSPDRADSLALAFAPIREMEPSMSIL